MHFSTAGKVESKTLIQTRLFEKLVRRNPLGFESAEQEPRTLQGGKKRLNGGRGLNGDTKMCRPNTAEKQKDPGEREGKNDPP